MSETGEAPGDVEREFEAWSRERFWSDEKTPTPPRVAFAAGFTAGFAASAAELKAARAERDGLSDACDGFQEMLVDAREDRDRFKDNHARLLELFRASAAERERLRALVAAWREIANAATRPGVKILTAPLSIYAGCANALEDALSSGQGGDGG